MLIPDVYRDTYPTVEVLQRCLNENSIVYGIDQDILQRMVLKRVCNKRILVAEGRPPEPGVDGRIELLIDISGIGIPKKLEDGSVEDTEASCAGSMEIVGGAIGSGNGKLICGGGLKVHHLENFDVEVQKDITVNDTILHSTVKTAEHLKAKTIVGGNVEASHGFEVDTIGTAAESKTVIKVGSTYFLLQQQKLLLEKREELQNGLTPGMTVAEAEKKLILTTLEFCNQNRTRAAEMLDISIRTLRNKLNEYGVIRE